MRDVDGLMKWWLAYKAQNEQRRAQSNVVPFPSTSQQVPSGTASPMTQNITKEMEAELVARGFSDAEIRTMTPLTAQLLIDTVQPAEHFTVISQGGKTVPECSQKNITIALRK